MMTRSYSWRLLVLSAAMLSVGSSSAVAQPSLESQSLLMRQRCDSVSAAIGVRLTPGNARSLLELRYCNESSGAIISRLWAVPGYDAEVLDLLVVSSGHVHDARIWGAVVSVIRDWSRKDHERAAALAVLANYLDPELLGSVSETQGNTYVQVGRAFHARSYVPGSQPITDSHQASIAALVEQLRTTEQSRNVGELASFIAIATPRTRLLRIESRNPVAQGQCARTADLVATRLKENPAILRNLRDCDASSPELLSRLWKTEMDAKVLQQLVLASGDVRDARTARAAIDVINDANRPIAVRAAALTVLASYMDPRVYGHVIETPAASPDVQLAFSSHAPRVIDGREPLSYRDTVAMVEVVRALRNGERGDLKSIAGMITLPGERRPPPPTGASAFESPPRERITQSPGCAPSSPTRTEMIKRFQVIVSAITSAAAKVRTSLQVPMIS